MLDPQLRTMLRDELERGIRHQGDNPALLDAANNIVSARKFPEDEPTVQVANRVVMAIYDHDTRGLTRDEYLRELRGALDDLRAIPEPAGGGGQAPTSAAG